MRRSWAVAAIFATLCLCSGSHAFADDAAQARFHDQRARSFYQQARFSDALREFLIVRRLAPQTQTAFNIALCFDQLGEKDQAFYYFNQFMETAPKEDARRSFAESALDRLRPRVARLTITSDPPGAEVFLDRTEHGSWGRTPVTVPLSEGPHEVWLDKPGFRRATRTVQTRLGARTTVTVDLVPVLGELRLASVPDARLVLSTPEGVTIAQDTTPFEQKLTPGVYVAELTAENHRPERLVMTVVEDKVVSRKAALEPLPFPKGEVWISTNTPDALVEIDGEPFDFTPLVQEVDIGLRNIRITADGTVPWEGEVDVRLEGRNYLNAVLQPPARVQRSPATWVAGGVGVASIIAAAITGAVALDTNNEFNRREAAGDTTNLAQLKDQGETFANVADGLWIAGGVSAVTSIVLYFVTAKKTPPSSARYKWEDTHDAAPVVGAVDSR